MVSENRRLVITNARLVRDDAVELGGVVIRDGVIESVGPKVVARSGKTETHLDAHGLYLCPGFIDLQVNGGRGFHFLDATGRQIETIIAFHQAHGTTGLLATLVTAPIKILREAMRRLEVVRNPAILGVHLEGPFISRKQKGAHNPDYIVPPSSETFRKLVYGHESAIRIMTLAPELPGSNELMEAIIRLGAIPSLGHSDATYEEARVAIERGVRFFTHIFNAMRGLHHRQPGAVGAALTSNVTVGLVADGIHVHPGAVRLLWRAKRVEEICLVTDSISAAGLGDGRYTLADLEMRVHDDRAALTNGTLAGSMLTMDQALRNVVAYTDATLPETVKMASTNPARLLGLGERKGHIKVGYDADFVLLDDNFNVHYTFIGGRLAYAR